MDKVQHFEIPADDLGRAGRFYKKLFGWNVTDASEPGMEYHVVHTAKTGKDGMIQESGAINGGIFRREHSEAPNIVITVKSIEKVLKDLKASGGKEISARTKVGKMGYYARIEDSEGNIVGLWENIPKGG